MARIIDNNRETLKDVLNRELGEVGEAAIATAYFNLMGFGDIEDGLRDKPLRLLLGRPPEETIKWEDEILRELEEYEDDPQYFKLLQRAIKYFEDPSRQVRIVEGRFFHGKAFMGIHPTINDVRRGFAVVGSSNFTHGGLVVNRELNMLNTDREAVKELADWFQRQWGDDASRDYKQEFLSKLKAYVTSWSPYEVVAKALWETYKKDLERREESALKKLHRHQILSFINALDKLEKYNGVLIADSTGLGKTRTALNLVYHYKRDSIKALLIAPKSILETTWRSEMRETDIWVEYINSEMLSANPSIVEKYTNDEQKPGLVVVDEAHFFRHPTTNRYNALSRLLALTKAKVVLATATPVNTSLMDLYHLLALYLPEDITLAEYGKRLREYFIENQKKWLNREPVDMDDLLRKFVVRHSRELAKALSKLKFPDRKLHTVKYELGVDVEKLVEALDRLNFAFYDLAVERLSGEFRLPDGSLVSKYIEQVENLKSLVKKVQGINLLKRLESSLEAFRTSVERLEQYIEYANEYAKQHLVYIPPRLKGDLFNLIDDEEGSQTLPEVGLIFSKKRELMDKCILKPEEAENFIKRNNEDLKTLEQVLNMLPQVDSKLEKVIEELMGLYPTLQGRNGVIVFTVYVDTAKYLYEHLKNRFKAYGHGDGGRMLLLVTGAGAEEASGKHLEEAEAVEQFQKHGGIMVSTDVLSAGQNLQNAQYVVNYDFPWNPVVLIQRAGRVDRLGSPYNTVYLYNVLPHKGSPDDPTTLEYFLNLMNKLYQRLEVIRKTIGLDASTLGEEAIPKDFSDQYRIAGEDNTVLAELERRIEQFTRDPLDDLARIINERVFDWIKQLPDGIGAVKKGERDGVFALFTDGQEHYWRLKWLETGETIDSPSEITTILLSGEVHNKGEQINYDELIDKLKQLKTELMQKLEKERMIRDTVEGVPPPNRDIRKIYEELERQGEYELAAKFRDASNDSQVVRVLKKAFEEGRLVEEARRLLYGRRGAERLERKPIRLKRVCWCVIKP